MPKVTFLPTGESIEVPAGTTILKAAKQAGAEVGYACGGVCACSTCHVYVKSGADSLSTQEEQEEDILDKAFDVRSSSRLSCQSKLGMATSPSRSARRAARPGSTSTPRRDASARARRGRATGEPALTLENLT